MAIVPRAEAAPTTSRRRSPVFQGIVPVDRSRVPGDVIAGVTLAALGIPEVMGYTTIAGMPVITGLYPILFASAYADQNELDYSTLTGAAAAEKISVLSGI